MRTNKTKNKVESNKLRKSQFSIQEPLGFLKNANIKQQLYTIYVMAVFIPITLIGSFLLWNTNRLLTNYHRDLLESDNLRVKTILFEITTQLYNISEEIAFDDTVQSVLEQSYAQKEKQLDAINRNAVLDNYVYNHSEIEQIEIYTDNPNVYEYKQYYAADESIKATDWYQKSTQTSGVFWTEMESIDRYENSYWNLCLVRKIPLVQSKYHAVLVIRLSDNYLKTRVNSQEYEMTISVNEGVVFYSSDKKMYGKPQMIEITYGDKYFQKEGNALVDGKKYYMEVTTLPLYQSESDIYVCTYNTQSYASINRIIYVCTIIIIVALVPQ